MSLARIIHAGWHILDLKVEDHPGIFLPSGYIKAEVLQWLDDQIAPATEKSRWLHQAKADGVWQLFCPTATQRDHGKTSNQYRHVLAFKDKDAAVMFKLRWGGAVHASVF